MSELYTKDILRWTMKIPNAGKLPGADRSVSVKSRICGSRIALDALLDQEGSICEFAWDVKACALGQAAAAIVGQHINGLGQAEAEAVRAQFEAQTKSGEQVDWGSFHDGKWADLADLALVHGHASRYGSVMLPFDALDAVFSCSASV